MKGKARSFICGTLAALAFSGAVFAEDAYLSIATGGTAGTYYPIGGAIAAAVTKGGKIQATAETGNASVANVNLVANGEIEVAFVQNDIVFWAYNGEIMFENKALKNVRTIAALYPEHMQLITAKQSGIAKFEDLRGKRVGIGAPGSGVEGDVRAIFATYGMTYDEMKVDYLDFAATSSRFKDDQIDAGFVVAGYPTASIMDLATTKDISLVSFDDETLKKLSEAHPYFVASEIPGGTYRGIDEPTKTPAVMALLVTHADVPDEVIYDFTKAMFDNIEDVRLSHAQGKSIDISTALEGLTAPLHPGAAKFYTEQGIDISGVPAAE